MIFTAVFDTKELNRKLIREWIAAYLISKEMDMNVLWFTKTSSERKIKELVSDIQIALISLDDNYGKSIGEHLYRLNPECRIIYYSSKPQELSSLMTTRPVGFFLWNEGKDAFSKKLDEVVYELFQSNNVFHHETKSEIFLIPYRNILYFQSDLKHVIVHNVSGNNSEFFSKLSHLEEKLTKDFVRIHKSYIVNSYYVDCVSKKNHTVELLNGEILPISTANYEATLKKFRK